MHSVCMRIIYQSHFQWLGLIFLHLETCSHVPAYGRLLSASGNPMQCQVPFLPQAQRWKCPVNSQLAYLILTRSDRFWVYLLERSCHFLCLSPPSAPGEALLRSARFLRRTCSCRLFLTPERKRRRRRMMTTIIHLTTPTIIPMATIFIYTIW